MAGATEGLRLPAALRAELVRLARSAHPEEACGLLLGRRTASDPGGGPCSRAVAALVHPARNLERALRGERFDLDPADQVAAEARAAALGLEVVALWHSHPDGVARPSRADREAAFAGWSHLIVALSAGGAAELRSWRAAAGGFEEEPLVP